MGDWVQLGVYLYLALNGSGMKEESALYEMPNMW